MKYEVGDYFAYYTKVNNVKNFLYFVKIIESVKDVAIYGVNFIENNEIGNSIGFMFEYELNKIEYLGKNVDLEMYKVLYL